jgi:hypothetical protein
MKKTLLALFILAVSANTLFAQEALYVSKDPGNDQTPALTSINMRGRGLNGSSYQWSIYTASVGGGNGVLPNAFEIWEYPPSIVNPNCCIQRFSINKSNGHPSSVMIDQNGGLALGGYTDAGNSFLAVKGNVGIGTTDTRGYQLAVSGNIHAQQITIDLNNWPDYVFKEDYSLIPLSQLRTYIDQHHHLPEIPSEKEIAEKGLNLGEMNRLLTKKVEELTLYLIEKDSKDKEQAATIMRQQEKLEAQVKVSQSAETRIKRLEEQLKLLMKKK